jgi:hypothetical protein
VHEVGLADIRQLQHLRLTELHEIAIDRAQ